MADTLFLPSEDATDSIFIFDWAGDPTFNRAPQLQTDGTYILYFSDAPRDKDGDIVSKGFPITAVNRNGDVGVYYVPPYIASPLQGVDPTVGTFATGCIGGIRPSGLDYTTGDTDFVYDDMGGAKIGCGIPAVLGTMIVGAIQGDIATGGNEFNIGDGSGSDVTYGYFNGTTTVPMFRKNTTTGKVEFSDNGTTFISIADNAASVTFKVTSSDTTADYASAKIVGDGSTIQTTVVNPSGNETLELSTLYTATPTEINTALDGIGTGVTATNLSTLTDGPTSNADALHTHGFATIDVVLGEDVDVTSGPVAGFVNKASLYETVIAISAGGNDILDQLTSTVRGGQTLTMPTGASYLNYVDVALVYGASTSTLSPSINVTVAVYAVSGGLPTGSALGSQVYNVDNTANTQSLPLLRIPFDVPVDVSDQSSIAVLFYTDSTTVTYLYGTNSSSAYAGGTYVFSTNSGTSWSSSSTEEVYMNAGITTRQANSAVTKMATSAASSQLTSIFGGVNYHGFGFRTGYYDKVSSVQFYLGNDGTTPTSGTVTVNLYAVDANGKPTGASLGTASINATTITSTSTTAYTFTPTTPWDVEHDTMYAVVISNTSENLELYYITSRTSLIGSVTALPYSGYRLTSTDSGTTWSLSNTDTLGFTVTGYSDFTSGEAYISLNGDYDEERKDFDGFFNESGLAGETVQMSVAGNVTGFSNIINAGQYAVSNTTPGAVALGQAGMFIGYGTGTDSIRFEEDIGDWYISSSAVTAGASVTPPAGANKAILFPSSNTNFGTQTVYKYGQTTSTVYVSSVAYQVSWTTDSTTSSSQITFSSTVTGTIYFYRS